MAPDPLSILYTAVYLAVVGGLYGLAVGVVWSPFLLAGRLRRLLGSLPPADWRVNYLLWIPLPGVVWGFAGGVVLSLSLDVRPQTDASPLYVSGVDGIVAATAVSLVLWPVLLLYVLPNRGYGWYGDDSGATTWLLVIVGTVWYLAWFVAPAYVLVLLAGLGEAFSRG